MTAPAARSRAPRAIAVGLNRDGIAGPRGKAWGQSTINGNRQRGTGILNNELYVGRLVWNRLEYVKDPDTGRRVSRRNAASEWRIIEVPTLRIVSQELWDAAKRRQQALDAKLEGKRDPGQNRRSGITATRRPAHLLPGLIRCGVCGGGMSLVGGASYGCSTARDKGTCGHRRTIKRRDIEAIVLQGLKEQLMAPEAVKEFVAEFHREINRLTAARRAEAEAGRRELDKIEREIRAIVEAIKAGAFSGVLQRELAALEARHAQLTAHAASPAPAPVAIHPNASEIYRKKVSQLHDALVAEDTRAGAAEALRALIDAIRVTPEERAMRSRSSASSVRSCSSRPTAKTPPRSMRRRVR